MRFLVAVLFTLLLGCNAIGGPPPSSPNRVIDCDDPESEAAATAAIEYINKYHHEGYKFRFNRIEEVKVIPKAASQEIFELELDLLETKCHVLSSTPLELCEVRPLAEHAVEGDCNVKLLKHNGNFSVTSIDCSTKADSAEDVAEVCPACPLLAAFKNAQVVQAVDTLVLLINSQDNNPFHKLHEIGRARIWAAPENAVELEFVIAATNCTTQDARDGAANCARFYGADAQYSFCVGRVKSNAASEDNVVNCTILQQQTGASNPPTVHQKTAVVHTVFVFEHGYYHLPDVSLTSTSAESSSSEADVHSGAVPSATPTNAPTAASATANIIVKRSLAGVPVPPAAAPVLPVCPGRIRFFDV